MRWRYINISSEEEITMSGWKLYVYGENMGDADMVERMILPVCSQFNVTVKVATSSIIRRNNLIKPSWGIAVIFLHSEMFQRNEVGLLVRSLQSALLLYNKVGNYGGSNIISGPLSYRYDLMIPVSPYTGLGYEEYLFYYRGEFGEYNIPLNEDIITLLQTHITDTINVGKIVVMV
jgi:hypothetical protein